MQSDLEWVAAKASARAVSMSKTRTVLSANTERKASSWYLAWAPQPMIAARVESLRAPYCAASAAVAAVRIPVSAIESMTASGLPFFASETTTMPWIVGRPRSLAFSGRLTLTFEAKARWEPGSSPDLT